MLSINPLSLCPTSPRGWSARRPPPGFYESSIVSRAACAVATITGRTRTEQMKKERRLVWRVLPTRHEFGRDGRGGGGRIWSDRHSRWAQPRLLRTFRQKPHEFAADSPLEGAGFEPSVPLYGELAALGRVRCDPRRHREAQNARSFASTNSVSDLRHAWGALT